MHRRKFLLFALLGAIVLCWTVGIVAAQENPVISKRSQAWDAYQSWVSERLKGDPAFQRYMQIYNQREQRLSDGSLVPKEKPHGTQQPGLKGGQK